MNYKTKIIKAKADQDNNGSISGYAATWTREPDSYGDVIVKGAFEESLKKIKAEGKVIPFLWDHDSQDLDSFIGVVTELKEDNHGLYFEAVFDSTPKAQRARDLAKDGRLAKFSFAYDIIERKDVRLPDGRLVNELRELNIHEVSLVMYPANPDTSVVGVKADAEEERRVKELIAKADSLLGGKSKKNIDELMKEADRILNS